MIGKNSIYTHTGVRIEWDCGIVIGRQQAITSSHDDIINSTETVRRIKASVADYRKSVYRMLHVITGEEKWMH